VTVDAPFRLRAHWFSAAVCLAVLVFLAVPLVILVIQSFTAEGYLKFPPARFGVRWYAHILESDRWMAAAARSLLIAAIAAPLALLVGTMAALALDRGPLAGRSWIYGVLIAPMVLPHVVLGLGFFRVVLGVNLDDTILALVMAHLTVAVPYVVVTVGASLQALDRAHEEAAQSLGANGWNVLRHVVLPGIRPGLVAGAIFAFIESFDEFIMTFFIATFNLTLPLQIFSTLAFQVEPSIAAASTLMLVLTALLTSLVMTHGQIVAGGRIVR